MAILPTKLATAALLGALLLAPPASAESLYLVSPNGKYLGNLNANRYDPNSATTRTRPAPTSRASSHPDPGTDDEAQPGAAARQSRSVSDLPSRIARGDTEPPPDLLPALGDPP